MHRGFLCCTEDSWWEIIFTRWAAILQLHLHSDNAPECLIWVKIGPKCSFVFVMSEKTLSSITFEWGMVKTKRAMLESLGNWLCPSGLFMQWMKFQITSTLYLPSLVSAFASSLTADGISSSSSMTKSLNSWESSSISRAEEYGNKFGYLKDITIDQVLRGIPCNRQNVRT